LYREDERDGPGLLSINDCGQDDVGFWLREHLVKLCVSVPGVFVVRDHWPLPLSPDDRLQVTTTRYGAGSPAWPVVDRTPPSPLPLPAAHLVDPRLPADSLAVDRQALDEAFDVAIDDWSQSWRHRLRQICTGQCQLPSSPDVRADP